MAEQTRRRFIDVAGLAGLAGLSGCRSLVESDSTGSDGSSPSPEAGPKLTAADGDAADEFGSSVAVDGTRAVLGAPHDADPNGENAGSAYVVEEGPDGWARAAKLALDRESPGSFFGGAVALSGDTALVGASGAKASERESTGAACVFEADGEDWTLATTLVADDGDSDDKFGTSVTLADGTVIVGAPEDEDPNGFVGGSAYVFERGDGGWTQTAKLTPDDGEKLDFFGGAVALGGDVAVVGAMFDDAGGEKGVGSAYVFERGDGGWTQTANLAASDRDKNDSFGESVSLAGEVALVGAPGNEEPNGEMSGSAYVFERGDDEWTERTRLAAKDGDAQDGFGTAVTLDGETALVGAPDDETADGSAAGSAYLFYSV